MKIYFDGGCRPNPGPMETAVVARGQLSHRTTIGHGTSEQAEWLALLDALAVARRLGERAPVLLGDSAGVVAQANGSARSRSPAARASRAEYERLASEFDDVRVRLVKRQQNLAGIALGMVRQGRRMSGGSQGAVS